MYNNVRFSTTNPWKFTRHTLTKRHIEIVNKVTIESVTGDVLDISADHTNKTADQTYKTADHTNKTADYNNKSADNTNKSTNHTNKTADQTYKTDDYTNKTADQMYKTADITNKTGDDTIEPVDNLEEPREHEISETNDEIAVNGFPIAKDTHENNLADDDTEKKQEQAVTKTQSHCDNEKKTCNDIRDENFRTGKTCRYILYNVHKRLKRFWVFSRLL